MSHALIVLREERLRLRLALEEVVHQESLTIEAKSRDRHLSLLHQEIVREIADVERAIACLSDPRRFARDCVEEWSSYASDYFRNKWNLEDDLAAIDAALTKEA